jgi:hypothetical protein
MANSKPSKQDLYKRGVVYDAIARLMPLEGRDFKVDVTFQPKLSVSITGQTPLGIAFAQHCQANMAASVAEVMDENPMKPPSKQEVMEAIARSLKKGKPSVRTSSNTKPRASGRKCAGAPVPSSRDTPKPVEQSVL